MKILFLLTLSFVAAIFSLLITLHNNENTIYLNPQHSILTTMPFEIGSGTGYFVNEDTIVTDAHVVIDNTILTAINYGTNEFSTLTLISKNDEQDLAVLHVDHAMKNIIPLCIATQSVSVGEQIRTAGYGNPELTNLNKDFHKGIITGFSEFIPYAGHKPLNYILADMDIIFGDSGSPVLSSNGCVIGNVDILPNYSIFPVFGTMGITPKDSLVSFLQSNNINVHFHSWTFMNDYERLDKATVRIAISQVPITESNLITLSN